MKILLKLFLLKVFFLSFFFERIKKKKKTSQFVGIAANKFLKRSFIFSKNVKMIRVVVVVVKGMKEENVV